MKTFLFIPLIFLLIGCNAPDINTIPNPIPKTVIKPLQNIPNPLPNVVPNLLGSNVKKEYFTGGKIRSKFIMSDKTGQNGLLKRYGYNGKITSTVHIKNGVKNGIETLFDGYGRVLKKTPYKNGRKNGIVAVYYPNGDPMAEITYVNNIRHGRAVKYNKDGSINEQVVFNNGRLTD